MTIPGPIGKAEIDNGVTIVARQRLACCRARGPSSLYARVTRG